MPRTIPSHRTEPGPLVAWAVLTTLLISGCAEQKPQASTPQPTAERAEPERLQPVSGGSGYDRSAETPGSSDAYGRGRGADEPTPTGWSPAPDSPDVPRGPAPPSVGGRDTPRTHVVQRGETLWAIARKYYGDGRQWRKIYAANRNRVADVNDLPVGIKLIIP